MIRRPPMCGWLGIALMVAVTAGLFSFRIVDLSVLDAAMKNAARHLSREPATFPAIAGSCLRLRATG